MSAAPVITVDGSSGSGKTTLGRRLAVRYGLALIDTGLVYRGVTVAAVRAGIDGDRRADLIRLARTTALEINCDPADDVSWHVLVDGTDAGPLLRDPSHALLLSTISQIPEVRAALLPSQRDHAADGAVVVGRDCGTVVFPDARPKFYLTADAHVRVQRRDAQLRASGAHVDTALVLDDVRGRDRLDAPSMEMASDAILVDTGHLDADAVYALAIAECERVGLLPEA